MAVGTARHSLLLMHDAQAPSRGLDGCGLLESSRRGISGVVDADADACACIRACSCVLEGQSEMGRMVEVEAEETWRGEAPTEVTKQRPSCQRAGLVGRLELTHAHAQAHAYTYSLEGEEVWRANSVGRRRCWGCLCL